MDRHPGKHTDICIYRYTDGCIEITPCPTGHHPLWAAPQMGLKNQKGSYVQSAKALKNRKKTNDFLSNRIKQNSLAAYVMIL